MITVSDYLEEVAEPALATCQPALPTPPRGIAHPLRLALYTFAAGADAAPAQRMQAALSMRYMEQQLARLGAAVALPPPLDADAPCTLADDVDAVVIFPAFCASPADLAALLAALERPGLVMALGTEFGDDGPSAAAYGSLPADDPAPDHKWIHGALFDVRAWFEAGQWLSALQASATLARRRFA